MRIRSFNERRNAKLKRNERKNDNKGKKNNVDFKNWSNQFRGERHFTERCIENFQKILIEK